MLGVKGIFEAKTCWDIFPRDISQIKTVYQQLVRKYHPDVSGLERKAADQLYIRINRFYQEAENRLQDINKTIRVSKEFVTASGVTKRISYLRESSFELGVQYIGSSIVSYEFFGNGKKYAENARENLGTLKYSDSGMADEFSKCVPKFVDLLDLKNGNSLLVLEKAPGYFRLQDILNCYPDGIPDRHVAWIVSRLLNLCCFFKSLNLSSNGISLDNCFINPEFHALTLVGGWWYSVGIGEPMLGTKKEIYNLMTPLLKTEKRGSSLTDIESVKYLGRYLIKNQPVPDSFEAWLNGGSTLSPFEEFQRWDDSLTESYGSHQFIPMELAEADVYHATA